MNRKINGEKRFINSANHQFYKDKEETHDGCDKCDRKTKYTFLNIDMELCRKHYIEKYVAFMKGKE